MKIILTQNLEKLGKKGDIKEVADGYARNFLFAKNLAKPATPSLIKAMADEKTQEESSKTKEIERYRELAEKLTKEEIHLSLALGQEDQAYGSISAKDIANALKKAGTSIEKEWIKLEEPIKKTGGWDIKIKLPHGIESSIKVVVEVKKEEKKRGRPKNIKSQTKHV